MHGSLVSIGQRLKKARREAGLNQTQVTEATGIGQASISRHEGGKQTPETDAIVLYANAYSVDAGWLLTGENPAVESHVEPVDEHPQERQLREFEGQHGDRFPAYVYRMIRASEYGRHGLTEGQLLDAAKRYQSQEEEALNAIAARLGPPKR